MMIAHQAPAPVLYREPGTPARLFVYGFALASPLLVMGAGIVPGAVAVRLSGPGRYAAAAATAIAYVALFFAGFRSVRRLASRFTPPLPLPGDIWNNGVAEPPRRSRNWPIRFRRRA